MPEDGKSYQIELKGPRRAYSAEAGKKAFWESCGQMIKSIRNAKVQDEEEDDADTDELLNGRLLRNPIVARFALSE
eukprot:CAMPEP_0170265154 /NCGR_PEP_ID=MMETSP0116_2-20130129/32482_1 /TAXON_ID=400756 /ORGANISM="Durinskia baltica, Strain CSIRO CS-38" /LENGTH=75 /DNA_ID=CAMNT_0010516267 /DNA_START=36 /DNA_END=260 /DNA_ORIENTATION=-